MLRAAGEAQARASELLTRTQLLLDQLDRPHAPSRPGRPRSDAVRYLVPVDRAVVTRVHATRAARALFELAAVIGPWCERLRDASSGLDPAVWAAGGRCVALLDQTAALRTDLAQLAADAELAAPELVGRVEVSIEPDHTPVSAPVDADVLLTPAQPLVAALARPLGAFVTASGELLDALFDVADRDTFALLARIDAFATGAPWRGSSVE